MNPVPTETRPGSGDRRPHAAGRFGGFTLLELMVVLAIVALAAGLGMQALPDGRQTRLSREADRLAALLESARARSRATGVPVLWRPAANGFVFEGLPPSADPLPGHWLHPGTRALGTAPVWLGPDPIIGAQSILLQGEAPDTLLRVSTDGLRPFGVHTEALP